MLAKALGLENAGKNTVTAIMPFDSATLSSLGLEADKDYYNGDDVIFADDIFGVEPGTINIKVWESFEPRTWFVNGVKHVSESHEPRQTPDGDILMIEGRPFYRHTELVEGMPIVDVPEGLPEERIAIVNGNLFLRHDGAQTPAKQMQAAAKVASQKLSGDDLPF